MFEKLNATTENEIVVDKSCTSNGTSNGILLNENDNDCKIALYKPNDIINDVSNKNKIPTNVTLTWREINVKCNRKILRNIDSKVILENVNGIVESGQMLALMGASGSGKTTLLNVLNFRNSGNLDIKGEVMINGIKTDPTKLAILSAYIQQDDLFFGTLTVKEHLEFHAMLRMDRSTPISIKKQRVNEVLKQFNLDVCKDTKIGITGRIKGISGGQKRRLSFASEILTDPPLLFCDEPTSGLDSYMAKSVVKCLQKMALNGKTIICSIHQPSSEIFALFDHVCILAEGNVAYFGARKDAATYFSVRLNLNLPQFSNPADFYIDSLGLDVTNEDECRIKIKECCDVFSKSPENDSLIEKINNVPQIEFKTPKNFYRYKSSWFTQVVLLLKRCFVNYFRDYKIALIDVTMCLITGLLGGLIYFQSSEIENDICTFNQKTAYNLGTALFYSLTVVVLLNVLAAVMAFPLEIPIILREHLNSVYRTDTYYISKFLFEIPIYIFLPTVYTITSYLMIRFGCDFQNFAFHLLGLILTANCAYSIGHVVSILSTNVNMAISLATPVIAIQILFCRYFLNAGKAPKVLSHIKFLSAFNYGYDLLSINQWENLPSLICEIPFEALCKSNGTEVLQHFEMKSEDRNYNIIMLIVLLFSWRILAYIILYIRALRSKFNFCLVKKNILKKK